MGASISLEIQAGRGRSPSNQIISIPGSFLPSCGQTSLLQLLSRFLCRRQEQCKIHFWLSLGFLPQAKNSHSESKGQPHPKPSQAVTLARLLPNRSSVREQVAGPAPHCEEKSHPKARKHPCLDRGRDRVTRWCLCTHKGKLQATGPYSVLLHYIRVIYSEPTGITLLREGLA